MLHEWWSLQRAPAVCDSRAGGRSHGTASATGVGCPSLQAISPDDYTKQLLQSLWTTPKTRAMKSLFPCPINNKEVPEKQGPKLQRKFPCPSTTALLLSLLASSPHLEAEVQAMSKVQRCLWGSSKSLPQTNSSSLSEGMAREDLLSWRTQHNLRLLTLRIRASSPAAPAQWFVLSDLRSEKRQIGQVCEAFCSQSGC